MKLLDYVVWKSMLNRKYDEEETEDDGWDDENVHSDDWGNTESEEEEGFDDDERD